MILARKSMGSVNILYIDDDYPTLEEPTGTFAFNTKGDYFVSGGKIWYRFVDDSYGEIYTLNNTFVYSGGAAGEWSLGDQQTFTVESMKNFVGIISRIEYQDTESPGPIRVFMAGSVEGLNSSTDRTWDIEMQLSHINNLLVYNTPKSIVGNTLTSASSRSHIRSSSFDTWSAESNDGTIIRLRYTRVGAGGGGSFTVPFQKITATGLERGNLIDESYFEGTFEDDGWVTADDAQVNKWHILSNGAYEGKSACISEDGINPTYNITSTSVSHLYKDIPISEYCNGLLVTQAWNCNGENDYDYGILWISPDTFTPTAGTSITAANATAIALLIGRTTYIVRTYINLSGSELNDYRGKNMRLIYEWRNDASIGNQPPLCIDNVKIYEFLGGDERTHIINDVFTNLNSWTTAQDGQTNYWIDGTTAIGVYQNGGTGAYITNNGTNAQYTNTSTSISHIYQDVEFSTGKTNFAIDFMWKCEGEDGQDYGRLYLLETSETPTAGNLPSSGGIIGSDYNLKGTTWNYEKINLPDSVAGTTKRLVLTWVNNDSVGTNPGMCISNLNVFCE